MASYRFFWDLKNSKAYSDHVVRQHDQNTPNSGGGLFKWVLANNTSIEDIPGYRIKPTSTTAGYWLRETNGEAFNTDWPGNVNTASQLTLQGYGLTAADITARYGFINSTGTGSNVVTLSDTYDTAAVKVALNTIFRGLFFSISFKPNTYYLNNTCWLPRKTTSNTFGSFGNYPMFGIYGNGCTILLHSTSSNTMTVFDRLIIDQGDADEQINSRFCIRDFTFQNGKLGRAIHLSATYGSVLDNIYINGYAYGIWIRFGLRNTLTNIETVMCDNVGVFIDTGAVSSATAAGVNYPGGWPGADVSLSNAQSNSAAIHYFRAWSSDKPNLIHILINGCSGVVLNEIIMEGNAGFVQGSNPPIPLEPAAYGIFFDNRSTGTIKDLTIRRLHLEVQHGTLNNGRKQYQYAAIFLRGSNNTQVVIDGIYSQYDSVIVDCWNSGFTNVIIKDICNITTASQFRYTAGASWLFENCRSFDPTDPTRWTTTPSTYIAPNTGTTSTLPAVVPPFKTWSANAVGDGNGVRVCYPFNVL